jgi:hypothetical protein
MSSYQERASEAEALVKAVVTTLESVPAKNREAVLADLLKDANVRRAVEREVKKSMSEEPSFSVCKAAMAHRSSPFSTSTSGASPSSLAKSIATRGGSNK